MTTEKMRAKSLGLFALSIFALVFVMGVASAAVIFSDDFNDGDLSGWTVTDNPDPLPQSSGSWTNTGTFVEAKPGNSSVSPPQGTSTLQRTISTVGFQNIVVKYDRRLGGLESGDEFNVSWSVDGDNFTILEETGTSSADDADFVSKSFNLPSSANNNASFELKFECTTNALSEFCRLDNVIVEGVAAPEEVLSCESTGNPGQLNVKRIDFNNRGLQYNTFGEDDEWFPFEEIEVEIRVENNGDDDVDDVSVEWGIWDTEQNQWVIDLDEEDEINLKDGDDETLTLTFSIDDDMDVDLDELGDGDHYRFYVVATGTVDNSILGDPETCASDFETASIVIESDFVILDNFNIPETVQCSETVTITADAWNIGDNDQDEVSVRITSNEFGLEEDFEAGDIDAFDNQRVTFTFTVPSDAEEKTYRLNFGVYDEDSDLYENDFDDDESVFMVPLQVSGNCGAVGEGEVSVVANIVSGGRAGQELVVRATVTNLGTSQRNYALNVAGFEDWASSFSLDQNTLTLGAGQSMDVLVTLDVNRDAAGSRTFFLELVSDGQLVRQPVTVSVSEARGFLGITGAAITSENWYLWGIGLLNLLLVVVIIVVAVRIARKK